MAESQSHKKVKKREAGRSGQTEVPLPRNRRLDAATARKAVEVERSGHMDRLEEAARRLLASNKPQRVLVVPAKDMPKAIKAMEKIGVSGTVQNLSDTRHQHVRPRKK